MSAIPALSPLWLAREIQRADGEVGAGRHVELMILLRRVADRASVSYIRTVLRTLSDEGVDVTTSPYTRDLVAQCDYMSHGVREGVASYRANLREGDKRTLAPVIRRMSRVERGTCSVSRCATEEDIRSVCMSVSGVGREIRTSDLVFDNSPHWDQLRSLVGSRTVRSRRHRRRRRGNK